MVIFCVLFSLIAVSLTAWAPPSQAASLIEPLSVVGTIEKQGSRLYFLTGNLCARYAISPNTGASELASLRRLSSGDLVTATGELDHNTCIATIESVDYVGLRQLLGLWVSEDGVITVRDFVSLRYYPLQSDHDSAKDKLKSEGRRKTSDFYNLTTETLHVGTPVDYRYSITPSEGDEWVVFLSDNQSTTFATIQLGRNTAIMKIFDSETGVLTRTLRLAKWGELKK